MDKQAFYKRQIATGKRKQHQQRQNDSYTEYNQNFLFRVLLNRHRNELTSLSLAVHLQELKKPYCASFVQFIIAKVLYLFNVSSLPRYTTNLQKRNSKTKFASIVMIKMIKSFMPAPSARLPKYVDRGVNTR